MHIKCAWCQQRSLNGQRSYINRELMRYQTNVVLLIAKFKKIFIYYASLMLKSATYINHRFRTRTKVSVVSYQDITTHIDYSSW